MGIAPKAVLILFGKGDQTARNPNATAMLRASAHADPARFYVQLLEQLPQPLSERLNFIP